MVFWFCGPFVTGFLSHTPEGPYIFPIFLSEAFPSLHHPSCPHPVRSDLAVTGFVSSALEVEDRHMTNGL